MTLVAEKRDNLVFASVAPPQTGATSIGELSFVELGAGDDWPSIIDQLLELHSLDDDWDGEGSPAPDPEVVNSALSLSTRLKSEGWHAPDRALASVNGFVVLEWYLAEGYLAIEVISPTQAEGSFIPQGAASAEVFHLSSN